MKGGSAGGLAVQDGVVSKQPSHACSDTSSAAKGDPAVHANVAPGQSQPPIKPAKTGPKASTQTDPKPAMTCSTRASEVGLFIELCAGTAQMSSCFHQAGFDVFPVDYEANRFHPLAKVCNLDLTLQSSWDFLHHLLESTRVFYIHAAFPCGTCSAARSIPLESSAPVPLRSHERLLGLPGLSDKDLDRVAKANAIYQMGATFLKRAHDMHVLWSVENATSSLLWSVPYLRPLMTEGVAVDFEMCMFGGERRARRTFLTNVPQLRNLSVFCDGKHSHKPFGKVKLPSGRWQFATKEEAAYPRPLCVQVVTLVARQLNIPLHITEPSPPAVSAAASAKQLRGPKVPPLMPEFQQTILHLQVSELPPVDAKRRLLQPCGAAPVGAKLLSTSQIGLETGDSDARFALVIGIYAGKADFLKASMSLSHPFDQLDALDDYCKSFGADGREGTRVGVRPAYSKA